MKKIVECVPNFSEGRNMETVDAISAAVRSIAGVKLLSNEPDKDYNRSVVTFIGEPDFVVKAAFAATRIAAERIDMEHHKGEHPRLGAADVVPFIPVSGASMEECVALSRQFGKRVAEELQIPVYLYEAAAAVPERKNLADIRKGEYEGLPEKLRDPKWKPDFGDPIFNKRSGATVTGARKFLIAYNVNLTTADDSLAQEIALRIREIGRPRKDVSGKVMKNEKGETLRIPGSLKAVKAMGVFVDRYHLSQVSINLVDYEVTPPHVAYEEVKKEARSLGIDVKGSEIVGLTPLQALVMAGNYYADRRGISASLSERELVTLATEELGLSRLEPFNSLKKIIEYQL